MPAKFVLDAHALIWFLQGDSRLGSAAKLVLVDPTSALDVPAIALAEAAWIVERGRTRIPSAAVLFDLIARDKRIDVAPLNREIVERASALTAISEIHDRLIVATALSLAAAGTTVVVLTRDADIAASGLVAVLW